MKITGKTLNIFNNRKDPHEQFTLVAPILDAALLIGAGGGFVLATILTLASIFASTIGPWWAAIAQAHGHLQLYGWAGLFVLGVAFHFLPRLRGAPLVAPRWIPWILAGVICSLLTRAFSQPLLVLSGAGIWRIGLAVSGVVECIALSGAVFLFVSTALRGPALSTRPAFRSILPFLVGAFCSLSLAAIINLLDMLQAATGGGFVSGVGDNLNVTLGLLGFLVPIALAMSARSLPMYAGLEAFPQRIMWPMAITYLAGLGLMCLGEGFDGAAFWATWLLGGGMVLVGLIILLFVAIFFWLMRSRGRLPGRVVQLAPAPEKVAQSYKTRVADERNTFGPFVALIASAYLWAILGSLLLLSYGVMVPLSITPPFSFDAVRHSFAIGFIALLICGIAPRMLPGFSGGHIVSARLVHATLWLGNCAAVLRVGSLLFSPLLAMINIGSVSLSSLLFALSGPLGLALAICLTVNLWPALNIPKQKQAQ
jgi:uncharacterized protein involved in response to NO